ncbi:flagellar M-ring protein FliF [Criibacterium bergeronii]|uniref:Flagellar M-ring protein n=1 Tax=Criibacterium bergeronii TaxID=1871336 RepID=A0A552VDU5_9FIRM|nr:flagellar M-ring protein FliF [Criibacterium bergeronii]
MENINKLRNSLNTFLEKYTRRQIVTVSLAALAVVAMLSFAIYQLTRTQYVTLYSNLDLTTMNQVTTTLDSMNVNYKIENQSSIAVPENQRNKIMVDLAGSGVPNAKFDYSQLINMNSMFMSDDEKNTAKQYALSNQISTVIESIPNIEKAYVNLSIPKNSEFVLEQNKQPTKASVVLSLKSGSTLDPQSINGIAALVANSVEGLTVENVTIHGPNGQVLNQNPSDTDSGALANSNLEVQEKVKKELEDSLHNFLSPMFGYENLSVMASVKLNFDTQSTQKKVFNPPIEGETGGIIRSEQRNKEVVENKNPALGTPGVTANDNEKGGTTNYVTVDENGNSKYNRTEDTINYEINEIVDSVEKAKGTIESITVSVILNKDSLEGGNLSDDKKTQIVNLITAATGLQTQAVEVFAESFNKDTTATQPIGGTIPLWQWIAIGLLALIPIIALVAFVVISRRRKKAEAEKQLGKMNQEKMDREVETIELDIKESVKKKSIEDLIEKNPEIVTQLLKTWMEEE